MRKHRMKTKLVCPRCGYRHKGTDERRVERLRTGRYVERINFCIKCMWPARLAERWGKARNRPPTFDDLRFGKHLMAVEQKRAEKLFPQLTEALSLATRYSEQKHAVLDFKSGRRASVVTEIRFGFRDEPEEDHWEIAVMAPKTGDWETDDGEGPERYCTPERITEILAEAWAREQADA